MKAIDVRPQIWMVAEAAVAWQACAALKIRVSTSNRLRDACTAVITKNFQRMVLAVQMHRGRRQALMGLCKGLPLPET